MGVGRRLSGRIDRLDRAGHGALRLARLIRVLAPLGGVVALVGAMLSCSGGPSLVGPVVGGSPDASAKGPTAAVRPSPPAPSLSPEPSAPKSEPDPKEVYILPTSAATASGSFGVFSQMGDWLEREGVPRTVRPSICFPRGHDVCDCGAFLVGAIPVLSCIYSTGEMIHSRVIFRAWKGRLVVVFKEDLGYIRGGECSEDDLDFCSVTADVVIKAGVMVVDDEGACEKHRKFGDPRAREPLFRRMCALVGRFDWRGGKLVRVGPLP